MHSVLPEQFHFAQALDRLSECLWRCVHIMVFTDDMHAEQYKQVFLTPYSLEDHLGLQVRPPPHGQEYVYTLEP